MNVKHDHFWQSRVKLFLATGHEWQAAGVLRLIRQPLHGTTSTGDR